MTLKTETDVNRLIRNVFKLKISKLLSINGNKKLMIIWYNSYNIILVNIYNASETGLFYLRLLDKILFYKGQT